MQRRMYFLAAWILVLVWTGCGGDDSPTGKGKERSGSVFVYNDLTNQDVEATITFLDEDRLPLEVTVEPGTYWTSEEFDGGTQLRVDLVVNVSGGRTNTKEIKISGSIRIRVTGYSNIYGGGENLYVELS